MKTSDTSGVTDMDRKRDRERFWTIHEPEEYICPDCLRGYEEVRRWEVHHINNEPGNAVGLCLTCHKVRHGADRVSIDLETWKEEFAAIGD